MNHGEMVNDSAVGRAVVRKGKLETIVESCLAHDDDISQRETIHESAMTN